MSRLTLPVALAAALAVASGALVGCRSTPKPDPYYRPTESVLEVIAVLRRHVPDDTYRFLPAVDFTGRNIYRSSLIRLENLQRLHEEDLRAGHMDDVIAFAKGRALERLRAYDLAAARYRESSRSEGPLRQDALRSASVCETLAEAARLGYDPDRPLDADERLEDGPDPRFPNTAAEVIAAYEQRSALLEALGEEVADSHYAYVVHEEQERADVLRARYFLAVRASTPDGDIRALSEAQRVTTRHRESKHANRHLLVLADLYAEMANEYVEAHPPESLLFDPVHFQELAGAATRLYEAVANQDGAPEKLQASHKLEAFLAFTLTVDSDRFAH